MKYKQLECENTDYILGVTYSFLLACSSHLAQGHREIPQTHLE